MKRNDKVCGQRGNIKVAAESFTSAGGGRASDGT